MRSSWDAWNMGCMGYIRSICCYIVYYTRTTATFKLCITCYVRYAIYAPSLPLILPHHLVLYIYLHSVTPLDNTDYAPAAPLAPAPLSVSCHSQMPVGSLPFKPFVKPLTMPFDRGEGIRESSRLASVTCEFFLFDFSAEHLQSTFLPVHRITLLHFY
jgi:hypothetical protein